MKILHTADWHIGQLFYEFDRTGGHQQFLDWLVGILKERNIDVLLIAGDIFDSANPSAASVRQFYRFLNKATSACPALQIVVTAGNHDSAARLETPKPLLESSNIYIIGIVEKDNEGNINYEQLIVPLRNTNGEVGGWCLAVPFLRTGDYPAMPEADNPYMAGVARLYEEAYQHAALKKLPGQPIIAMGHLHAQQAEITDMDKQERLIMGGVECIGADSFPKDLSYVALGHIHKAQRIGGKEHIRYSGSPLPLSFSEVNYKHQVFVFELESTGIREQAIIEVPLFVPLQKVPGVHSNLQDVLLALQQLPDHNNQQLPAPYLEVRVLADGPEPGLRHKVEQALTGKYVRLARIDVRYAGTANEVAGLQAEATAQLQDLNPATVFQKAFLTKYNAVPEELMNLFNQVAGEATLNDTL